MRSATCTSLILPTTWSGGSRAPRTLGSGQPQGEITTVAGDYAADQGASHGQGAFSGNGGPAIDAQLYAPEGVALDDAGDLFIADTFNNSIREVTPNGQISSLVNTSASQRRAEQRGDGLHSQTGRPLCSGRRRHDG